MKIGLVIVDAWYTDTKIVDSFGLDPVPKWSDEVKENVINFSKFLTYVCDYERDKGTTIIHSLGTKTDNFLKNIDVSQVKMRKGDSIVGSDSLGRSIMANELDEVYWGGFHFGKCIHTHSNRTHQYLNKIGVVDINCLNLVLNLSMILPEKSWGHYINGKRAWTLNWGNHKVRDSLKETFTEDAEILPRNMVNPNETYQAFKSGIRYNHHLWSLNGFESLPLRSVF
mgnify:FL=1